MQVFRWKTFFQTNLTIRHIINSNRNLPLSVPPSFIMGKEKEGFFYISFSQWTTVPATNRFEKTCLSSYFIFWLYSWQCFKAESETPINFDTRSSNVKISFASLKIKIWPIPSFLEWKEEQVLSFIVDLCSLLTALESTPLDLLW